jgi:hypothetical protein
MNGQFVLLDFAQDKLVELVETSFLGGRLGPWGAFTLTEIPISLTDTVQRMIASSLYGIVSYDLPPLL